MAATVAAKQQPRKGDSTQAALFDAMHAVARDFSVDVTTVAFRPGDGGAVSHKFVGVAPEEQMRRLIEMDVSTMDPAELSKHAARLQAMRAALVRKLLRSRSPTVK